MLSLYIYYYYIVLSCVGCHCVTPTASGAFAYHVCPRMKTDNMFYASAPLSTESPLLCFCYRCEMCKRRLFIFGANLACCSCDTAGAVEQLRVVAFAYEFCCFWQQQQWQHCSGTCSPVASTVHGRHLCCIKCHTRRQRRPATRTASAIRTLGMTHAAYLF